MSIGGYWIIIGSCVTAVVLIGVTYATFRKKTQWSSKHKA